MPYLTLTVISLFFCNAKIFIYITFIFIFFLFIRRVYTLSPIFIFKLFLRILYINIYKNKTYLHILLVYLCVHNIEMYIVNTEKCLISRLLHFQNFLLSSCDIIRNDIKYVLCMCRQLN